MKDWKFYHWIALAAGFGGAVLLISAGISADRLARIGAGYKAKIACSEIFLAGRDPQTVINSEFEGINPVMSQISVTPDQRTKSASAAGPLGLGRTRAVYREGYGCTLANAGRLRALPDASPAFAGDPWPLATAAAGIDRQSLNSALEVAFAENESNHRAVLVIVDGKLAAERYADGFDQNTPFLSWSMAKSVTATLIGAAVLDGLIDIDDPAPVASWASDPQRSKITWRDLLQMQSGLEFEEDYANPRSDVNRMLFEMADAGAPAEQSALTTPPGEVWHYSSGSTNLLSKLLRQELSAAGVEYHRFAREKIFEPIGALSMVMEPDAAGNFIGSSFVYATARDWARLGQLYLKDGVWKGERVLPEGWAAFVGAPASQSDGQYGAHFWLNRDGGSERERFLPGLPEEVYYMAGHEGQYVFIIPSRRMVIVRTGMTRGRAAIPLIAPLLEEIHASVDAPA